MELYRLLKEAVGIHQCLAAVEYAASRPGQGVSSVFTFGQSYGAVKAVCSLVCGYLVIHTVAPITWQKEMLGITGETKEASLAEADKLAKEAGLTKKIGRCHGLSDAICMAVWGSRHPEKLKD